VLSNQVDAAGSAEDSRLIAEQLLEMLPEFVFVHQNRYA
jgi:hypothetical protein